MKTTTDPLKEWTRRSRAAGLVHVSVWVPQEHKAAILAECKRLRERHLTQATTERLTETEPSTENQPHD
jgi:hypothetical protein